MVALQVGFGDPGAGWAGRVVPGFRARFLVGLDHVASLASSAFPGGDGAHWLRVLDHAGEGSGVRWMGFWITLDKGAGVVGWGFESESLMH